MARTADADIPAAVAAVFASYAPRQRAELMRLRRIILKTAAKMESIGAVEETLRWGQPSYIAEGGSTVRIGPVTGEPDRYAVYFTCHTNLVATFRGLYPDFDYGGNRSIAFGIADKIPEDALRHCISLALRYRRGKRL